MSYRKSIFHLFVLLSFSILTSNALAGDCETEDFSDLDYQTMLSIFAGSSCFKDEHNKTPLAKSVRAKLNNAVDDDTVRAIKALSAIQSSLEGEYLIPGSLQFDNAAILRESITELQTSIINNRVPQQALKADWQFRKIERPPIALEGLDFSDALTADRCAKVSDGNCAEEFDAAANLVRSIYLVNDALDTYTKVYRTEAFADRVLRRTKWDSYYDDLTFQYFWELWANSLLLEYTDNREVVEGNKRGFRDLPGSKLVFLHPEANLVYAKNTANEYDITVTVEALGFEVFDFDAKGKVKNPWGVSLLAAYMGEPDKAESGWTAGLLFKYDGYSIGVTDNHGEVGVVFNINLAQRIFDVKQENRRYYDEFNNRIQALEVLGQQSIRQANKIFVIAD
ncbi:MAG: hypothetical protein ACC650_05310 [Gammaproteobacteria bacterium]